MLIKTKPYHPHLAYCPVTWDLFVCHYCPPKARRERLVLQTCSPNTIRTGGRCRCLPGSRPGVTGCLPCGEGYFCPGGDVRKLCPGSELSSIAEVQAANTLLDLMDSASCVCPAGTKSATGDPGCVLCGHGTYCPAGLPEAMCPANAWSPTGSKSRADCLCDVGYDPAGTGALQDPWTVCTLYRDCAPRVELSVTLAKVALQAFGSANSAQRALLVSAASAAAVPVAAVRVSSIKYALAYCQPITRAMQGTLTTAAAPQTLTAVQMHAESALVSIGVVDLEIRVTVSSADDAVAFNVFVDDAAFINDPRRQRLLQTGASPSNKIAFSEAVVAVQCTVPIHGDHSLPHLFDYKPTMLGFDFVMSLVFDVGIVTGELLDSATLAAVMADTFEASIDRGAAENTVGGRMRQAGDAVPVQAAPVQIVLVVEADAFDVAATTQRLSRDAVLATITGAAPGAAPICVVFRGASNALSPPAGGVAIVVCNPNHLPAQDPLDPGQTCSPSATKSSATAFACVCGTGAVCEPTPLDASLGCVSEEGYICAPRDDPAESGTPLEVWIAVGVGLLFLTGVVLGYVVHVCSKARALPHFV